jgi:hypothetical protein
METVGVIFMLLSMLGLMGGIAGLFKPEWLTDKKRGVTPSRKQIGAGIFGMLVLFGVGVAMIPGAQKPAKADVAADVAKPKAEEVAVADVPEPTAEKPKLDIALSDWIQRMNKQLKEVDSPALTVSTDQGKCDVWCASTYESGKSVAWSVTHRDGRINEIFMMAAGDGTVQSSAQIMMGLFSMTHALTTGLTKQEISKKTMTLLNEALESGKSERTIGAVRYSASKIDGMGLFITASK